MMYFNGTILLYMYIHSAAPLGPLHTAHHTHLLPAEPPLVQTLLLCGALDHPLLYAVLRDEPEGADLIRLSNSTGAVHGLQIGLWVPKISKVSIEDNGRVTWDIPVTVVKNDNVGCGEVDSRLIPRPSA